MNFEPASRQAGVERRSLIIIQHSLFSVRYCDIGIDG